MKRNRSDPLSIRFQSAFDPLSSPFQPWLRPPPWSLALWAPICGFDLWFFRWWSRLSFSRWLAVGQITGSFCHASTIILLARFGIVALPHSRCHVAVLFTFWVLENWRSFVLMITKSLIVLRWLPSPDVFTSYLVNIFPLQIDWINLKGFFKNLSERWQNVG